MPEIVVIGAGVIGLAVAEELARHGADVHCYERGTVGRQASWAAGGMLAPYTEHLPASQLRTWCEASLQLFPTFAARLMEVSGVDVHCELSGILEVAWSEGDEQRLQQRLLSTPDAQWLVDRDVYACTAVLAPGARAAIFSPREGRVDNRRLLRALTAAARHAGVVIHEQAEVLALETTERRVLGVRTALGFVAAGVVINAMGAWAGALPGAPDTAVRPVKGQMCTIAVPEGYLDHVVWSHGIYAIPRGDGRLVIGATVEECGFDQRVTVGGLIQVLTGLQRSFPGAASCAVTETWANWRPGTPDEAPFIGSTACEGYYRAAGHYRNGILLAPITAQILRNEVLGGYHSEGQRKMVEA